MAIELYKNMAYEWVEGPVPIAVERLLWLDPTSASVWTISIYDPKARAKLLEGITAEDPQTGIK